MANYQVHFGWGISALRKYLDSADVIVWVDVLGDNQFPHELLPSSRSVPILLSNLEESFAVADWAVNYQLSQHRRLVFAVIGAGPADVALEDFLAAGAVIERLAQQGIDALAPEAAVANASYSSLERAVGHLIAASENGRLHAAEAQDFYINANFSPDAVRSITS